MLILTAWVCLRNWPFQSNKVRHFVPYEHRHTIYPCVSDTRGLPCHHVLLFRKEQEEEQETRRADKTDTNQNKTNKNNKSIPMLQGCFMGMVAWNMLLPPSHLYQLKWCTLPGIEFVFNLDVLWILVGGGRPLFFCFMIHAALKKCSIIKRWTSVLQVKRTLSN